MIDWNQPHRMIIGLNVENERNGEQIEKYSLLWQIETRKWYEGGTNSLQFHKNPFRNRTEYFFNSSPILRLPSPLYFRKYQQKPPQKKLIFKIAFSFTVAQNLEIVWQRCRIGALRLCRQLTTAYQTIDLYVDLKNRYKIRYQSTSINVVCELWNHRQVRISVDDLYRFTTCWLPIQ